MDSIVISIIMPTYNSARTIEESLQSIRNQNFDRDKVEILIVDGGSTDDTLEIAKKYNCRILNNERRLPEFAKQIGFDEAKGEWGIFIDSDEMFLNMDSFANRIKFLGQNPKVKNLVSTGMSCADNETFINRYANRIADPFSWFVYRYNGYNRMKSMRKRFPHKDLAGGKVFSFKNAPYVPLYDALGNMFNMEAAREIYKSENEDKNFVANIFEKMTEKYKYAAILDDDFCLHKPGMTKETYRKKMIWRIKNNLFASEGVGFSGRTKKGDYLTKRKYLYVLYSGTFIPVLIDAIKLSVVNKDIGFMSHFYWNEYVFFNIVKYVIIKVLGLPVEDLKSYGK